MDITKRNYKKILKELKLSEYPSLDEYLIKIKEKLISKQTLTVSEELMSFPRLKNYFENYRKEQNKYYVSTLNFDKFSHRPPRSFQEDGIKFLLLNDRAILADDMGCIEEDTIISCNLNGNSHFKCTIFELYKKLNEK